MKPLVVILPVSRPDFHLACQWLRWVRILTRRPFDLLVVPAHSVLPPEVATLKRLTDKMNWIPCWIPCAEVRQVAEYYERPDLGYAAAANHLFRSALELAEIHHPGQPVLWCESDCIPLTPEWVTEITREYEQCGKPFMGAFHPVGAIPHMSGNAVYPPNWRELAPSLAELPGKNPGQGWDSACAHETVPQMHVAKTIQQEWVVPPVTQDVFERYVKPETVLFHRCKDGTLIAFLAQSEFGVHLPLDPAVVPPTSVVEYPKVESNGVKSVGILIVTHARDMEFLRFCLKSIKAHAIGFSSVHVVVPSHEVAQFGWVHKFAALHGFDEPPGKGMMAHEVQKCRADHWVPAVDAVLHLDADCQFFRRVTPQDYLPSGRCLTVFEPYSKITNPNRFIWAETVKNATGLTIDRDFMVRHPQIHPIGVYPMTRVMVEKHTRRPFAEYVLSCKNEFPQGFAEFPTLSAVGQLLMPHFYAAAEYDKAEDAKIARTDPAHFQYVYRRDRDFLVEHWSHGGMAKYKSVCEAIEAGRLPAYWVK